jgi:hypothetical protein
MPHINTLCWGWWNSGFHKQAFNSQINPLNSESLSYSANFHSSVAAALSSVFPHTELSQFLEASRKDREKQISELTQITTGIRLFNRDCQKGGEGIEDRKCDL